MIRVTVKQPGMFIFDGDGVFLAGWEFGIDGNRPVNDVEQRQLIKASIAAVLDCIGGQLEMVDTPPDINNDIGSEKMVADLIKRVKGQS